MKNKFNITNLYKLNNTDKELMVQTLLSAFKEYPKLLNAFPDKNIRLNALEATIRYYSSYDYFYGAAFSLDKNIREVAVLVHSDNMRYSFFRHFISGGYNFNYVKSIFRLSSSDRRKRKQLFNELDNLEKQINIPLPHIYLDFLGTKEDYQGMGRGKKLMNYICNYADELRIPIMLFTNTDADVKFYKKLGFSVIGITESKEFGFKNTYLLYTPR